MKSSVSLIVFCVFISCKICSFEAIKYPDSFYELDGSTDSECTLRYLKNERNLELNFPMSEPPPKCRLTWADTIRILKADMQDFMEKVIPNDSKCLSNEIVKREKTLDLILTITSIQASDSFAESEKKSQLTSFRNNFKQHLKEISTECRVAEDKFISTFRGAFENNETLIAWETDYCLAKYVTDRNILTLVDVNLNPKNIEIKNLNCTFVIEEEVRKVEEEFSRTIAARGDSPTATSCLMNLYKKNKICDLDFAAVVLGKLAIPSETKSVELNKINELRSVLSSKC